MTETPPTPRLIIYGHDFCSQAWLLKTTLNKERIDYEWRDIAADESHHVELRRVAHGHLSVPTVVFPDGAVMVEPWPKQVLAKLGHVPDQSRIRKWLHGG